MWTGMLGWRRIFGIENSLVSSCWQRSTRVSLFKVALAKVIRAMGVKEFAAKVGMASPNLLRALNPRHNPTQEP